MAAIFIGRRNRNKITFPPHVTDKIYHIRFYRVHLAMSGNLINN